MYRRHRRGRINPLPRVGTHRVRPHGRPVGPGARVPEPRASAGVPEHRMPEPQGSRTPAPPTPRVEPDCAPRPARPVLRELVLL